MYLGKCLLWLIWTYFLQFLLPPTWLLGVITWGTILMHSLHGDYFTLKTDLNWVCIIGDLSFISFNCKKCRTMFESWMLSYPQQYIFSFFLKGKFRFWNTGVFTTDVSYSKARFAQVGIFFTLRLFAWESFINKKVVIQINYAPPSRQL